MKRREIEGRRECGGGIGMNRLEGVRGGGAKGCVKGWCEEIALCFYGT
ncbi:hypothetical protein [Bartonella sp. AP19HLJMH]